MVSKTQWADLAVKGIVSAAERAAARQELLDHIDDHMADLMAAGFSKEDAETHAVYVMGDPKDTANLLRKAHQPILTRILQISKWVILQLAILLLAFYVQWGDSQLKDLIPPTLDYNEYSPFLTPGYNNSGWTKKLYILEEPVSATCQGFRFTVERVAVLRDEKGKPQIILLMRAQSDGPLHKVPRLGGTMEIRDDLGNCFFALNQDDTLNRDCLVTWEYTDAAAEEGWHHIIVRYDRPGDHDFQWIELEYTMEQTSFSLHIDLTEEVLVK